jgi:hypothetical protein
MKLLARAVLLGCVFAVATAKESDPALPIIPMNPETHRRELLEVVHQDGTAAELFGRTKAWIAIAYNSPRTVLQLDDPASGRLAVKAIFIVPSFAVDDVSYTIMIEVKDGRYRYSIGDLIIHVSFGQAHDEIVGENVDENKRKTRKLLENLAAQSEVLIASLKVAMQIPTPAAADW